MFRQYVAALTCIVAISFAQAAGAGTIIRLSLDEGPNFEFTGAGVFGTVGDQDTTIEFTGDFSGIADTSGRFNLSDLTAASFANLIGPVVIQEFTGGMFSLWDLNNVLLLTGTLTNSVLTGTTGDPGTAAVFTTSFGSFTGGTLRNQLIDDSLTLSIAMDDVRTDGSLGLEVEVIGPGLPDEGELVLQPFQADGSVVIGGEIPEPTSVLLAMVGAVMVLAAAVRRRRS